MTQLGGRIGGALCLFLWPLGTTGQAAAHPPPEMPFATVVAAEAGQDQPAPPAADSGQDSPTTEAPKGGTQSQPAEAADHKTDTHMFGVLPNYATVEDPTHVQPITRSQKFKLAELGAFDPIVFPFAGLSAVLNRQFGRGARGYAEQYAASLADTIIGNIMTTGVMPSLLHQDPRYYRRGTGSGGRRAGYAATRIFIGHSDAGRPQFNASELGGVSVAAGLSNLYYPKDTRTLSGTLTRVGLQLMWDAVANELKEFWPDVRDHLHKKPTKPDAAK